MFWQESTEEELERLLDKIMVLFRFIHGMLHTHRHRHIRAS